MGVALIALFLGLTALSIRSGYSIHDVESMNWDIALMLSPYGFIKNLVWEANHYLAPYYGEKAARGSLLADPLLLLSILFCTASGLTGLWWIRNDT
ncbi:MAG: hypothetical protein AB7F86_20550 [Bdellovibrionales bacterium]